MQSTLKHHASYNTDAQLYRDNKKYVPYYLEQQEEDSLSVFMTGLYQKLLPSKDSYQKRLQLTKKIEQILHNEWPDYNMQAHIFGSSVNNLGTSNSDVDLCITSPCSGSPDVRTLATLFQSYDMRNIVCVPGAKVPIVRFFDPEFRLACDININNTIALENTRMVKTYVALDYRVRPLIMIIKHWTKQRDLNNAAYGGTLTSYTWTCMVINFLQTRSPPILPSLHGGRDRFSDDIDKYYDFGIKNKETLGGLFYTFFRRFAIEFDYYTQVLSVHQGKILTKSEKGWDVGRNRYCLCVEEPLTLTRNLGNTADPASVCGIRMECLRVISLLIWEKAEFNTLFDPYVPMQFPFYHRHYSQPPLYQQPQKTVFYNIPYTMNQHHPLPSPQFTYSDNSNLLYGQQQQRLQPQQQQQQQPQQQQHAIYGNYIIPPHNQTFIDMKHDGNDHIMPSTLLNMLDLSRNYSHDRSVDSIFARYHREALEDNDRRRASTKGFVRKNNPVAEDWSLVKVKHVRNGVHHDEMNGTVEQKKTDKPQEQELPPPPPPKQQPVQHQKAASQPHKKKVSKQEKQPPLEKQEEKPSGQQQEKQVQEQQRPQPKKGNRHRGHSISKRKYQQHEQKDQKQHQTTEIKNQQISSQKKTETDNPSSIETSATTTKPKSNKKKNKKKPRRRQKSSNSEQEKKM